DEHELFSRAAKSLVFYGTPTDAQGDQAVGLTLKLIAEKNPYTLRAEQDHPLRLTYQGRPLPATLVVAMNRANPTEKMTARTDKTGHVTFRLQQEGIWLTKVVHMVPAPVGTNADWASFWASLTFELKSSGTGAAAK